MRMAIFPFCLELAQSRGDDGQTRCHVTYETVREWCHKFGSLYASRLKRQRPCIGSKWQLDEVFTMMNKIQVAPASLTALIMENFGIVLLRAWLFSSSTARNVIFQVWKLPKS